MLAVFFYFDLVGDLLNCDKNIDLERIQKQHSKLIDHRSKFSTNYLSTPNIYFYYTHD